MRPFFPILTTCLLTAALLDAAEVPALKPNIIYIDQIDGACTGPGDLLVVRPGS